MRPALIIAGFLYSLTMLGQQFYVSGDAILYISPGANLVLDCDLENEGTILNTGTVTLYGDWGVNHVFNGNEGSLNFLNSENQTINIPSITVKSFTMSQDGAVNIESEEFVVTGDFSLLNGVVTASENTRFVLENDVRVIGGSLASYFQGKLTYKGSGIRKFPVGWNGTYAPITLLEVFGSDPELTVSYRSSNTQTPIPDENLLGISGKGIWEVTLTEGSIEATPIQIDFQNEDLENFSVYNNIRHRVSSPVIAVSDAPGGTFVSLGVASLLDTDSTTYGSIIGEQKYALGDAMQTAYFAIALAPQVVPEGLVYIPEIFSPSAINPNNRTFRVFGERISEENFKMEIYNQYSILVYSTDSFTEANQTGWDGVNQTTGNEESSELYYYQVMLTRENGQVQKFQGPFYLQR